MNYKYLFFIFIVIVWGCGTRKEIIPKYRFEIGKELTYLIKADVNLNADLGLFYYNSKVALDSKIAFKAIGTNDYGYRIQCDIKDVNMEGLSNQIEVAALVGINSLRKLLSEFDIDEYGKARVMVNGVEVNYLSYLVEVFFVGLKDINEKVFFSTNVYGWLDKNTPIVSKYEYESFIKEKRGNVILIYQSGSVNTFERENFEKSVEPVSLGLIKYEMNSKFDLVNGRMLDKNLVIDFKYEVPLKQGLIKTKLKVSGNGEIKVSPFELEI